MIAMLKFYVLKEVIEEFQCEIEILLDRAPELN